MTDPCKQHSENVCRRSHCMLQLQHECPKVLCIHWISCTIHALRVLELKMKSIFNEHKVRPFWLLTIAYHAKCSMVARSVLDQQALN